MPLVKNTITGNHYLKKINTDGDACARTAIRSYDKQTATEGQTQFNLPFVYEPASYTLWVYVNGQKAEFEPSPDSEATIKQLLQYDETGTQSVTFWYGLADGDVLEFIVAGSYQGESGTGGLTQDLTPYKTIFGSDIGQGPAQNFITNQPMGGYKFTGLPVGTDPSDSVNLSQLGSQTTAGGEHYHSYLWDDGKTVPVIVTFGGEVDITGFTGRVTINGTYPEVQFVDTNSGTQARIANEGDYLRLNGGASFANNLMLFHTGNGTATLYNNLQMNGSGTPAQIRQLADGTLDHHAVNLGQLKEYRGIHRIAPVQIYSHPEGTPAGLGSGLSTSYDSGQLLASTYGVTVPSWANGLIFRLYVEVDQNINSYMSTWPAGASGHTGTIQFWAGGAGLGGWETPVVVEMGNTHHATDSCNGTDYFARKWNEANNEAFRFRWNYERNSATALTLPAIEVVIWLIGYYR